MGNRLPSHIYQHTTIEMQNFNFQNQQNNPMYFVGIHDTLTHFAQNIDKILMDKRQEQPVCLWVLTGAKRELPGDLSGGTVPVCPCGMARQRGIAGHKINAGGAFKASSCGIVSYGIRCADPADSQSAAALPVRHRLRPEPCQKRSRSWRHCRGDPHLRTSCRKKRSDLREAGPAGIRRWRRPWGRRLP